MEDKGYRAVRIGDPSDWRLVLVLSERGMEAYLRNIENPMEDVETLLREEWDLRDRALLDRVESTVYDHPQMLDDFATDIAIVTDRAMWVPESVVESQDDPSTRIFRTVYESREEDIMQDFTDGKVCLYTLAPGLQSFLQRTFPGARIRCHQTVMVKRFSERSADLPRVYIDMRKTEADFVMFDGKKLLMAVTHEWNALTDIRYHLLNLLDVYDIDPKGVHVSVSGSAEIREQRAELMQMLREDVAYVMVTMVPGIATKAGMSLPAALLMRV